MRTPLTRDFADTQNRFYSENIPRNIINTFLQRKYPGNYIINKIRSDVQEKLTSYDDDEDDDPFADIEWIVNK